MTLPLEHKEFISNYPTLAAIGNTPTVKLNLGTFKGGSEIYAKFEQLNPGGSIKDRPVLRMLTDAVLKGRLKKHQVILDATSGNAGIAYAMIGATLGYKVELVMPENASEERKKRLIAHGAKLTFTNPMLGYDETIREVKRLYESAPDKYFYSDQYSNINNPLAHYETTAEEILKQVSNITHFVAGVGTGGTISGVGLKLKEHDPNIQVIGINFDEWPGVEGLKPLGQGHIKPDTFNEKIVDQMIHIDVEEGYRMYKKLASSGIFAGQSSGAYIHAAQIIAKDLSKGKIVTIINDMGERYFSTGLWD